MKNDNFGGRDVKIISRRPAYEYGVTIKQEQRFLPMDDIT